MKKILLFIILLFSFNIANAGIYELNNPTHSGDKIGWVENENQDNINYSLNIACFDSGYSSYVKYEVIENDSDKVTYYDLGDSDWKTAQLSDSNKGYEVSKIYCDDGKGGGLMVDSIPGKGSFEILTINSGKVYIEFDNFLYLIISILVISLLFRSVIFIFKTSFLFGRNLTKGKTYFSNK